MQPSAAGDVHIESTTPLITPIDLVYKLPVSPQVERTVVSGREEVRSILSGKMRV